MATFYNIDKIWVLQCSPSTKKYFLQCKTLTKCLFDNDHIRHFDVRKLYIRKVEIRHRHMVPVSILSWLYLPLLNSYINWTLYSGKKCLPWLWGLVVSSPLEELLVVRSNPARVYVCRVVAFSKKKNVSDWRMAVQLIKTLSELWLLRSKRPNSSHLSIHFHLTHLDSYVNLNY
jgi:hypothetical protein